MSPLRPRTRGTCTGAGDGGYALVAVMVAMVGLTLFAFLAMSVAVRATLPSRSTGDVVTATAAAQAGIDEYIARLAENSTYYAINSSGDDATNKAFVVKRDGTPYSDGRDVRGIRVPGTGTNGAFFRYQLLTSPTQTSLGGTIRLRSTGTVPASGARPAQSRTLTATLQQPGFLQYIYFTDVESLDPVLYDTENVTAEVGGAEYRQPSTNTVYLYYADPAMVTDRCSKKYYEGRNAPRYTSAAAARIWEQRYDRANQNASWTRTGTKTKSTDYGKTVTFTCTNISFGGNDVIAGSLHSNDALQIGGAVTFQNAQTETSWADGATPAPTAGRRWWGTGTPSSNLPVYAAPLPLPSTNDDLRTYAAKGGTGCTYTGETRLRFENGTVKVWSPGTASTPAGGCLPGSSANEQTLTSVPAVIYVKDSTASCSPRLGYPQTDEDTSGTTTDYDCKAGTAYVQGQLSGQTTIAAERDVVVTGDITYAGGSSGSDVLGLIANNYVWVYNPYKADGTALPGATGDRRIDAAVLSLQHSFIVQNYTRGGGYRGTLTVNGVLAQKFRGPVGTTGPTGFKKNYIYDERLRYLPPPYFLTPTSSPWTMTRVTDG